MTKYKMQTDINKTWLHTLLFFAKLFAQRKAYGHDCAANSGFNSAVHINTYQPIAALSPPPVTSPPVISTLRASRNYLWLRRSMLPRAHPYPRQTGPSGPIMHQTQHSTQAVQPHHEAKLCSHSGYGQRKCRGGRWGQWWPRWQRWGWQW